MKYTAQLFHVNAARSMVDELGSSTNIFSGRLDQEHKPLTRCIRQIRLAPRGNLAESSEQLNADDLAGLLNQLPLLPRYGPSEQLATKEICGR